MSDPAENSESPTTVRKSRRIMKQNADDLGCICGEPGHQMENCPTSGKQIKKSKPTEKAEPMHISEQSETPDLIKSCDPLEKSEVMERSGVEEELSPSGSIKNIELMETTEPIDMPEQIQSPDPDNRSETLEMSESIEKSIPMDTFEPIEKSEPVENNAELVEQLKTVRTSPTLDTQIEKSERLKSDSIEKIETHNLLWKFDPIEKIKLLGQPEPLKADLIEKSEPVENRAVMVESELLETSEEMPIKVKPDLTNIRRQIRKQKDKNLCFSCGKTGHKKIDCPAVMVESELLETSKEMPIEVKPDLPNTPRQIRKQKDQNLCFSCGKTGHKKIDCPLRNKITENAEQILAETEAKDPSQKLDKGNTEEKPIGESNQEVGDLPRKKRKGSRQRRAIRERLEKAAETVKLAETEEKTESLSSATAKNGETETTITDGSEETMNISLEISNTNNLKETKPKKVASTVPLHDASKKAAVKYPAATKRNNSSKLDTGTKRHRLMTKEPEAAKSERLKSNATSASTGDLKKQTTTPQIDKTLTKVKTKNNSSKAGAKRNNTSELDTATKRPRQMTKEPEAAKSASLKSNATSASTGDIKNQTTTPTGDLKNQPTTPQIVKTLMKVETKSNSYKAGAKIMVQIGRGGNIQPPQIVRETIIQPQIGLKNFNIPANQVKQMEVQYNSNVNAVPQSMNPAEYTHYCPLDPKMLFITFDPYKASITQLPPGRKNPPDSYVYNLDFSVTYEFTGRAIYAQKQNLEAKAHCTIQFPPEDPSKTCFKLIGTKQMIQKMRKNIQKCIEMNHPISSKQFMDVIVPGCPGHRAIEMKISGKTAFRMNSNNGRVVDAISKKACVSLVFYPDGFQDESIERFLQIIGPPPGCLYAQKLVNGFIQRVMHEKLEKSFPPNQPSHPPFQQPPIMQPNPFTQQRFQQPPMMPPNNALAQQRFQQPPMMPPSQPFPQRFQQPSPMPLNQPFAQQRFQQPPPMPPNQPFAQQRFQQPPPMQQPNPFSQPPPMMQPRHPFSQQSFQQPPPGMFNNVNQMPPQPQNQQTPQNLIVGTPVGHVPKDNRPTLGQHDFRAGFEGYQDSRSSFGQPVNNTPFGQPSSNNSFRPPVNNTTFGLPGNQPGFEQSDKKAAFGHSDYMPKFTDMSRQAPFASSGIITSQQMYNAPALKNPDNPPLPRLPEAPEIQNVTPEVSGHVSEPPSSEDIASQLLEYCVSILSDIKNKPKPQQSSPAPISSTQVEPILQQLSSLISLSTPQNPQSSTDQLPLAPPKNQQQSLVIDYQHSSTQPDVPDQRSWPQPDLFENLHSSEKHYPRQY